MASDGGLQLEAFVENFDESVNGRCEDVLASFVEDHMIDHRVDVVAGRCIVAVGSVHSGPAVEVRLHQVFFVIAGEFQSCEGVSDCPHQTQVAEFPS